MKELDGAVALFLLDPSSSTALSVVRAVRRLKAEASDRRGGAGQIDDLYLDARALHHAVILLESDPVVVERNALARILVALEPVMQTLKVAFKPKRRTTRKLLDDVLGAILDIGSASQYLEVARLNADMHFEEEMLNVEERLIALFEDVIPGSLDRMELAADFCDRVRAGAGAPENKAVLIFALRTLVCIISYVGLRRDSR